MAKRNIAEREADRIVKALKPVQDRLSNDIAKRIKAGQSAGKAVSAAVTKYRYEDILTDEIISGVSNVIKNVTGAGIGAGKREWYLDHVWKGDDMALSQRINDVSRMDDIKETITTAMRQADDWRKTATSLIDQDLTKADYPKYLRELETSARRLIGGDGTALEEYRRNLARAVENIENLAQNGAPTQRLKAAYESVVRGAEKKSVEALDASIKQAVREKARYNAERIARTESAKAYAQGTYKEALDDEQVIGIGYDLNGGHPREDICDFHTGVDLFGLGAGRYPLDALPPYPFHPQCLCLSYNVYSGDATKLDKGAAKEFLDDLDKDDRKALLGVEGERQFQENPNTWEDNLRNYEGHEDIKDLMEGGI